MCQDKESSSKKHPSLPAQGQGQQDAGDLGQPNSKVHPGRMLSWSIGIVNEGLGWAELPFVPLSRSFPL